MKKNNAGGKKEPNESGKNKPSEGWGKTIFEIIMLLVWVGASVIASQFVVGYLMLWILGSDAFDQPAVTAVFSATSYLVAVLLVVFIPPKILKTKRMSRKELGLSGLPTWTDIGLAPVGFVVYLGLGMAITALFELFPWFNTSEAQELGFSPYLVGGDRIIAFITLVVIAPIMEEIIFRGWLYRKLRVKTSSKVNNTASIAVSAFLVSLLFGLIHGQWNVGVNVFAMSLVLCGLREVTGTIYSGILLHMIKNGLAFYLLYVAGIG